MENKTTCSPWDHTLSVYWLWWSTDWYWNRQQCCCAKVTQTANRSPVNEINQSPRLKLFCCVQSLCNEMVLIILSVVTKLHWTLREDENTHASWFIWTLKMNVMTFFNGCYGYKWPLINNFKYDSWILMVLILMECCYFHWFTIKLFHICRCIYLLV